MVIVAQQCEGTYSMSMNHTLKNGSEGKLYVMYFTTINKLKRWFYFMGSD